ncbi:hypothetical protein J4711_04600 [Staphylococcus epidermidis]|nr:hypothetical protein [Staphylococcus epidermidis]
MKHIYSIEKGKLEIGNILISEGYNKVKNLGKNNERRYSPISYERNEC